jgi:predicted dehydrogenase
MKGMANRETEERASSASSTVGLLTPDGKVADPSLCRPRIGFLGVGWIGRQRMDAVLASGHAEVVAVADASAAACDAAGSAVPGAATVSSLDELLALEPDGIVIATPSALHADQSIAALEAGAAVFCQKPLGRTAAEVRDVAATARRRNLLLGVDFSYRHTEAMCRIRELVTAGALGELYAVDLVFHNAYGPDKPWFYDPALAGGGCVMDLGVHLVDLALWTLGFPAVRRVDAQLFSGGRELGAEAATVEDYASVQIQLATGVSLRLACSWRLPAGRDAVIGASFYGTSGGAALHNVDGSFYDFVAERYRGTARETLTRPPDAWGGRAAVDWAHRLARGERFDPGVEQFVEVAEVLDRIYGR